MNTLRKRTAFTLIELLIVIAIIAVLSALAISSIIGVRKAAKETDSISVLREVVTAEELFRSRGMGGSSRFGSLAELADTPVGDQNLIRWPDPALPGVRNDYQFEDVEPPTAGTWLVRARPIVPGISGDMYFAALEDGQVRRGPTLPADRAAVLAMNILPE